MRGDKLHRRVGYGRLHACREGGYAHASETQHPNPNPAAAQLLSNDPLPPPKSHHLTARPEMSPETSSSCTATAAASRRSRSGSTLEVGKVEVAVERMREDEGMRG